LDSAVWSEDQELESDACYLTVLGDHLPVERDHVSDVPDESYLPAEPRAGLTIHQPMATLDVHTRLGDVSLFTIIATLGAPLEVTAASLAIETFLPADADSAARLQELAELSQQSAAAPA
jgi:hypothetical protein